MTNKEFQEILAKYPDDYTIQLDNAFGWETPSNKNKVDPHLYVNTDCGFIEIEPPEIRDIWINPEDESPKDGQSCLILEKDFLGYGGRQPVGLVTYDSEKKGFTDWDYYNDTEYVIPIDEVAAWMPIPRYERNDK